MGLSIILKVNHILIRKSNDLWYYHTVFIAKIIFLGNTKSSISGEGDFYGLDKSCDGGLRRRYG